jgi:hypothetical protein
MQLERELATYRANLPELLQHEAKYVLIHGDSILDTYATYADALRQGYRQVGLEPFLVKQIARFEPIRFIRRPIERVLRTNKRKQ